MKIRLLENTSFLRSLIFLESYFLIKYNKNEKNTTPFTTPQYKRFHQFCTEGYQQQFAFSD